MLWLSPTLASQKLHSFQQHRPVAVITVRKAVGRGHILDYSAVCPELPGCASAGETEEEARANIREAIELYLAPGDIELPENAKLVEVTVG